MRGIEQLPDAARVAPDVEEVTQGERSVVRRLDVDDARLVRVHVQPVVTAQRAADVGRDGNSAAPQEELQIGVIVDLRVLELVAGDGREGTYPRRRGRSSRRAGF